MKFYTVAIDKMYFRRDLWPKEINGTSIMYLVTVLAESRTDAAQKAWKKYSAEWRKEFTPFVMRVSLYVNEPNSIMQGTLTRLSPISLGDIINA